MLRERIPPWGSSRGLETPLARGSADPRPPRASPTPRPEGPEGGARGTRRPGRFGPFGDRAVGGRERARRPYP